MKALNDLVQSGKIHYVGVSNVTGWQFQRIIDLCREKGYNQIVSNQVRLKMYRMHCLSSTSELYFIHKYFHAKNI